MSLTIQNYLKGNDLRFILFYPTYKSDTHLLLLSFTLWIVHLEKKQLLAAQQLIEKDLGTKACHKLAINTILLIQAANITAEHISNVTQKPYKNHFVLIDFVWEYHKLLWAVYVCKHWQTEEDSNKRDQTEELKETRTDKNKSHEWKANQ